MHYIFANFSEIVQLSIVIYFSSTGHDLPVDCILPLIPKLTYTKHSEALTHIMIMLKREKPTADLVKHLMSRDPVPMDRFVTAVLTCWINEYEDKIGDLIGSQLCKQASPAGGKRKRTHTNKSGTSLGALAEMTLNHLDNLRQTCKQYDLFNLRSIQQALQTVRSFCTESQKKKFSDLFALADSESDEESDPKPNKPNKSNRNPKHSKSPAKQKPKGSGGGSVKNTDSSGMSSESEEDLQPPKKQSKGRNNTKQKQKRAIVTKVSYKEIVSADYSTEDEDNPRNNTPKKRKKVDSESD